MFKKTQDLGKGRFFNAAAWRVARAADRFHPGDVDMMDEKKGPRSCVPYLLFVVTLVGTVVDGFAASDKVAVDELRASVAIRRVIDGDSLEVIDGKNHREIRLWGIDAPEYDQPGSASAKERLKELTSGGRGNITVKDRDRYGRFVAMLECGETNVNEALVASGNAWVHVYYCNESICDKWKRLERDARKNHLGLWRGDNPVAPWKWKSKRR